MEAHTLDRVRELIRQLDSPSALQLNAEEAEGVMAEILAPLLDDAGYRIERTGEEPDLGMDFLATRKEPSDGPPESIAIEYKHVRSKVVGIDVVHRILGAAVSAGINRAMVVTNARFTHGAHESIRRSTPAQVDLLDIDALRSWLGRLAKVPEVNARTVEIIRTAMCQELIRAIVNNPRSLDNIEWREMEHLLREVFEGIGFDATLTPGSKDGGKDIILTCRISTEAKTYYVEVKHWRSGQRVGPGPIKDFLNLIVNEEIDGGLFLSSSGYCSEAIESLTEIERRQLRFGSESKVVGLCKSYLRARTGIWMPDPSFNTLAAGAQ